MNCKYLSTCNYYCHHLWRYDLVFRSRKCILLHSVKGWIKKLLFCFVAFIKVDDLFLILDNSAVPTHRLNDSAFVHWVSQTTMHWVGKNFLCISVQTGFRKKYQITHLCIDWAEHRIYCLTTKGLGKKFCSNYWVIGTWVDGRDEPLYWFERDVGYNSMQQLRAIANVLQLKTWIVYILGFFFC